MEKIMKNKLLISALTLSTLLGIAMVQADEPVKEKGVLKSLTDVVKSTVGDVKKAITKDRKPDSAGNSSQDTDGGDGGNEVGTTEEPKKAIENIAGDAGDAEANRKVSDSSIAVFSQNPYIQSIMQKTTHIKAARLKELMARGDKVTMLDIRPRSEFAKTPGVKGVTLNIPRNFLEVEAYEKLPNKEASIIIISTKGIRGGLATNTLKNMGYTNVRNLMDGLQGWNKTK
jgi:rhodanese-related sulfurtransferase